MNEKIEIDQDVIDDLKKNHNVDAIHEISNVLHTPVEKLDITVTHTKEEDES
jgi:hypothetical protein